MYAGTVETIGRYMVTVDCRETPSGNYERVLIPRRLFDKAPKLGDVVRMDVDEDVVLTVTDRRGNPR